MTTPEHAGCIPGQCRAGDHHKAVRCGEPASSIEGDVAAAIARVEKSRHTHIEWREHWRKYESHVCSETPCPWETAYAAEQAIAGDMAHQEEAISGYDNVLAVLRSVAQRPGAVRCGEPADGATWGGGPSAEGALTEAEREALDAAARSTNLVVSYLQLDAICVEVERILAARSQRPEAALADALDELHQETVGRQQAASALMRVLNPDDDPKPTGDLLIDMAVWARRLLDQRDEARALLAQRPEGVTVTEALAGLAAVVTECEEHLRDAEFHQVWPAYKDNEAECTDECPGCCAIGLLDAAMRVIAEVSGDTEAGDPR